MSMPSYPRADSERAATTRAQALLQARRFSEALRELQPHLAGGTMQVLTLAAQAELKLHHYPQAQRLAEQASAAHPNSVTAALVLAKVMSERRQPWRVHAIISSALALAPDDPRLHTQWVLADLLANKVNERTEDLARQAVALQPANPTARQILSVVLYRRKDRSKFLEARQLAQQAATESPATALSGITVSLTARRRWNPLPPLRHEAQSLRDNPADGNAKSVVISALVTLFGAGLLIQTVALFAALKFAYDGYSNTDVDDVLVVTAAETLSAVTLGVLLLWLVIVLGLGRDRGTVAQVGRRSSLVVSCAGFQLAVVACLLCAFTWDTNHARVWLLTGFSAALLGALVAGIAIWFRRRAAFAER